MKVFQENRKGVVPYIIVLAVILLVAVQAFPQLNFRAKYQTKEIDNKISYTMEDSTSGSVHTSSGSSGYTTSGYLIGREIEGIIKNVTIDISPDAPPFLYHYNDTLKLTAIPETTEGYKPAPPFKCTWGNYPSYTGTDCTNTPSARFPIGQTAVTVKLCDSYGACVSGRRFITVGYKDPIQVIHDEWENHVTTGSKSGNWVFDESTMTIKTTQNVGFTGYYNPDDKDLKDYKISFSMGVTDSWDDDAIGFVFRRTDDRNMYVFSIDNRTANGGVGSYHSGLYKIQNGKKTRLVDLMPMSWTRNSFMDVEIQAEGGQIEITVDGQPVVNVRDSNPLLKGSYGPFTISQANGEFRNLSVETLQ
ncbi:hypothetical protein IMZ31_23355 (plasmid) [Pontibacillus sp. ALD_SL1]|uniref:family 16 glycoside hydrolase n=1 Tax=Pontibacillus sp. ALD_SL1 TaxID=2777185 RepID=UPI001A967551|nr:family 16 glycoside hydrolase [Pontibacillus sp. ALD_SL1]QST02390.1 hypothetical protein IMZ31_23355 [Pontibacillus sp. ALD_SL1]